MSSTQDRIKKYKAYRQIDLSKISDLQTLSNQAVTDKAFLLNFKVACRDLRSLLDDFEKQHMNLITILAVIDDADLEGEEVIRKDFMRKFNEVESVYHRLIDLPEQENQRLQSIKHVPNVKLPKVDLMVFTGDVKNFPSFIDIFNALVHNNESLSDIEKFNYLLSILKGPPLAFVKCTPLLSTNYQIAYTTLVDRYSNSRILATAYWKEIANSQRLHVEDAQALRHLLDIFNENLSALSNLNFEVINWDFILMNMLLDRLDSETLKAFETSYASSEIPTYQELREFLLKHCVALESISLSSPKRGKIAENRVSFTSPRNVTHTMLKNKSSYFVNTQAASCILCDSTHAIYQCPLFLSKTPHQRYECAKKEKCCLNCLATAHSTINCTSKNKCRKCKKSHHTLLHFNKNSNTSPTTEVVRTSDVLPSTSTNPNTFSETDDTVSPINSFAGIMPNQNHVLLPTVILNIQDGFGNYRQARALIDSASQANFITKKLVNKLQLQTYRTAISIQGVDTMRSPVHSSVHGKIKPTHTDHPVLDFDAFVLDKICTDMPSMKISVNNWRHISNIKLADSSFNKPGEIDLLLGADIFPLILEQGRLTGNSDEPIALNTLFGWVLIGKLPLSFSNNRHSFFVSLNNRNLNYTLERFWQIEEVPNIKVSSPEDTYCENYFEKTTYRNSEGRFVVSLPFRNNSIPSFGDTRSLALRRFYSLERRFLHNPELRNAYCAFMRDYLRNGHMEPVKHSDSHDDAYFIPHHCVMKKESSTTPLRVVFDASSHAANKPSLNNLLYTGPKLQNDLPTILLNFRLYQFVFTADIKQMYRQILVTPTDRQFQRIIWRFSETEPITEYQLTTVTFGVVCSPYLAIRTLLQLATEEKDYPLASEILRSSTYVDDICSGAHDIADALSMQQQLINLLHKGGFKLRKWASNDPRLLKHFPESHLENQSLSFDFEHCNTIKILGLYWSPSKDAFFFSLSLDKSNVPATKRNILSHLARIFDPLGFLAPITVLAKLLIQHLWALGLQWDELPPTDVIQKWEKFKCELELLAKFQLPRHIDLYSAVSTELHGFCDASEKAYSAVCYLRVIYTQNNIKTFFIAAKSKVAPLKRLSVPRLELCAAVLLTKLISFILHAFKDSTQIKNISAWSDSSVALYWLKSSPHQWKTFVSNRVVYIQDKVAPELWHYVPSSLNAADIATRGIFPSDLINCSHWWVGPTFLSQSNNTWNLPELIKPNISQMSFEQKKIVLVATPYIDSFELVLNNFSSLAKIKRIFAYVLRFIYNIKHRNNKIIASYISCNELSKALLALVKYIQSNAFASEISAIRKGKPLPKQLRKLNPFLDENDMLRVGGRLSQSTLSYNNKFPLLLPSNSRFTMLLIEEIHKTFLHTGVQTTHFLLLQTFWIFSAKRVIRKVISKCVTCWKTNPKPFQPPMASLPKFRVSQVKVFKCTGVDFCGPFNITLGKTRGSKTVKAYVCVFVCCATKALHFELTSDLSSESFLAALRRFIARRGRCTDIHSDCGTNFVGAFKFIRQIMQDAAKEEAITWHFNPPSAPHFGGLWEAGVKSLKSHLVKIIGSQILTYEEFNTVLIQIEAVLNSRPLCPVSTDPNDLMALTPGHFLTLEPLTALPDPDTTPININRLTRWQLLQRMHRDFWNRWHAEYLHTLHQRAKWLVSPTDVNVGALVLIKNDTASPLEWQLARIVQLHPGADGIVRVVTVKTTKGLLKRPLVKLCPLPTC